MQGGESRLMNAGDMVIIPKAVAHTWSESEHRLSERPAEGDGEQVDRTRRRSPSLAEVWVLRCCFRVSLSLGPPRRNYHNERHQPTRLLQSQQPNPSH